MNKQSILKIAGVKSDKEFYKKYPTEEAFMKAHKKEFKKAQVGVMMPQTPYKMQQFQMPNLGVQAPNTQVPYAPGYVNYAQPPQFMNPRKVGGMQNMMSSGNNVWGNPNVPTALMPPAPIPQFIDPQSVGGMQNMESFTKQPAQDYFSSFKTPKNTPANMEKAAPKKNDTIGKILGPAPKIIEGVQALAEEKKALQRAQQAEKVSDVALQASRTRPEQVQRRYVRPEDQQMTGDELFPMNGVKTNVLTAKNGGEIANTYAPNTLYDDLGYEPLNDSVKQYYFGGKMKKADFGSVMGDIAEQGGGDVASQLITAIGGENAGGNLGGTIGGTIGSFFGPAGKMIGQVGGQLVGALIDKNPQNIKKAQDASMRNISAMGFQNGMQASQIQNSSFMKDGGMVDSDYEWVSHTWQPQVIASFGEHKMSDLLRPDRTMDTLRSGGHLKEYTNPSEAAMSTERMAMGGELKTHWGGYAEPMSTNPYLPDGGEMVMFRGQSHDESDGKGRTGIGVTYGENPVEVERGEPAVKLQDGGGSAGNSMHVLGNIKINSGLASLLDDQKIDGKSISGMKFKNAGKLISEKTNKVNKMMDDAADSLASMDVSSPFDKLSFNTQKARVDGGDQKLKKYANQIQDLAMLQNAVNSTEEEKLMKITDDGNIATARNGIAQSGKKLKSLEAKSLYKQSKGKAENFFGNVTDKDFEDLKSRNSWYDWKGFNSHKKEDVKKFQQAYNNEAKKLGLSTNIKDDGLFGEQTASARGLYDDNAPAVVQDQPGTPLKTIDPGFFQFPTTAPTTAPTTIAPIKGLSWMDYANQVLPYLRPSDAEPLDPNQLYGEMNALANNQLEPVRAQTFQPELGVPYDISYQDILNQNQADYRSQQRMVGYNPAAQSILNAQKYGANEKVLGEQFRANQAMKDRVYGENRNILNQSKLQNLGILDNQYVRQEQAKSNTKNIAQAALNSISAKYAQNKLENRTLQTYENQYKFRYDPRFRAMNMNPLAQFDMDGSGGGAGQAGGLNPNYEFTYNAQGEIIGARKKNPNKKVTGRNGAIVKNLKNI